MTHYIRPIDFIDTINIKYPTYRVSASGDSTVYANIDWNGFTPIDEATLITDKLSAYRGLIDQRIREDAHIQRMSKVKMVLGTTDTEQIRTYEEKYVEAKAYLADNNKPTPIMSGETAYTGETVAGLAPRVVGEFEYAKNILQGMYGQIEGQRRNAISLINAMTLEQLEAFTGPAWT